MTVGIGREFFTVIDGYAKQKSNRNLELKFVKI